VDLVDKKVAMICEPCWLYLVMINYLAISSAMDTRELVYKSRVEVRQGGHKSGIREYFVPC